MESQRLAQRWIALNKLYTRNGNYGLKEAPNQIRSQTRDSRLLFTAPHSVRHYHSSAQPDIPPDTYTGGLCDLFGELLGASTLTASSFVNTRKAWSERSDTMKYAITHAATNMVFIIDLHGMSNKHGMDICIGLGSQPSDRVRQVVSNLQHMLSPLIVTVDQPYAARRPYTITSYVQSLGGDAIQIEIARKIRNPLYDPVMSGEAVQQMIKALNSSFYQPAN